MARVLVTGASGFVGGHLVERLAADGHHVRCLVRASSSRTVLAPLGVEFVVGDVCDRGAVAAAVSGVDAVFHAGGLTNARRTQDLYRVNGAGAEAVSAACAAQPVPPVLILVSSLAAAGPAIPGRPRTEHDPAAPVSHYGRSKLAGELAARRWARRVPTTIVRPGVVFGPRNRELLPIFRTIRQLRVHFYPGLAAPPLSYIEARDLAALLVAAWRSGRRLPADAAPRGAARAQGVYFAAANEHPTYAEFGKLIARSLDLRACLVMPLVFPLPWLAAGAAEGVSHLLRRSNSFNLDKIREAAEPSWACSGAAAQTQLDFRPSAPLAEQLRVNSRWYRDQGWL